jgi:hypothetical protein
VACAFFFEAGWVSAGAAYEGVNELDESPKSPIRIRRSPICNIVMPLAISLIAKR